MNRQEFAQIAVVLDECWPISGPFTETAEAAYFAVLKGKTAQSIEAACQRLVERGHKYRPTPSELVKASVADVDRLQLFQANVRFYTQRYGLHVALELLDPHNQLQAHYPAEIQDQQRAGISQGSKEQ
jgi:hypothetical protein